MVRFLLVGVAAALVLAPAHAASPRYVIQGDSVLGGYAVKRNGTLQGAIERFGQPRLARLYRGSVCRAAWPSIGFVITFYNLGGRDPCKPQYGYFGRAVVTGRLWRTSKGVRIGDPERLLRTHYPGVRFRSHPYWGRGYWLVVRTTLIGEGGPYPGLLARVRNGRIVEFRVHYPAGGD